MNKTVEEIENNIKDLQRELQEIQNFNKTHTAITGIKNECVVKDFNNILFIWNSLLDKNETFIYDSTHKKIQIELYTGATGDFVKYNYEEPVYLNTFKFLRSLMEHKIFIKNPQDLEEKTQENNTFGSNFKQAKIKPGASIIDPSQNISYWPEKHKDKILIVKNSKNFERIELHNSDIGTVYTNVHNLINIAIN